LKSNPPYTDLTWVSGGLDIACVLGEFDLTWVSGGFELTSVSGRIDLTWVLRDLI
jgi:hypothetical protein